MSQSTFEGVVQNGNIRLDGDILLPENSRVYVIVGEACEQFLPRIRTPRLAHPEQSADFRKQIVEVVADAQL